jgi:hypothetical protein
MHFSYVPILKTYWTVDITDAKYQLGLRERFNAEWDVMEN